MRILIIDDTTQRFARHCGGRCEYDGNEVVDASNGQDELALVGRETLDLVLLDVEMPDMGASRCSGTCTGRATRYRS